MTPPNPCRTIALFRPDAQADCSLVDLMLESLSACGCTVVVNPEFAPQVARQAKEINWRVEEIPSPDCEMVISLGGDGSFLKASAWSLHSSKSLPVAGVSAGHLGFLAAWKREDVQRLINGEYCSREAALLEVKCDRLPPDAWCLALNEVTVMRTESAQMIDVEARLNGLPLTLYTGDGLIVSTPTGSTGYNLSAGGPILQPDMRALILTPVAPHTLTQRPLVIERDSELELRVHARAGSFLLSLDGISYTLNSGDSIEVKMSRTRTLPILTDPKEDFACRLRTKLMWGLDPREQR